MHILTKDYIENYYTSFICSYENVNTNPIKSYPGYIPETFFVCQKRGAEKLIFFQDLNYKDWVLNMVRDICRDFFDDIHDIELFYNTVFRNVETLMEYQKTDARIANQEFVDVIRRVVLFTLYGDVTLDFNMSARFNGLSKRIMPFVLSEIRKRNLSIKELLVYSILSGLSGLDLKGAPAASSAYVNTGIPMKSYFDIDPDKAAELYLNELDVIRNNCTLGLFDYNDFLTMLEKKQEVLWMTDDYIESHFDLLIVERLLNEYDVNITIVPKNGYHGNDLCYFDLIEILDSNMFSMLRRYIKNGRLKMIPTGPKMGAANVNKFSQECVNLIEKSDFLFMKGCRIHEMLQGGLNKDTFSSFVVVRNLSEITSGFDASKKTVLFFHLAPCEYSFFGTNFSDVVLASRKESISTFAVSTIREHFERKNSQSIEYVVNEFSRLSKLLNSYSGNAIPIYEELNLLAKRIEEYTTSQYNTTSCIYEKIDRPDMGKIDVALWNVLSRHIENSLEQDITGVSLLDVGTGDGRSLEYLFKLGVNAFGIDNSQGFLNILAKKCAAGILPPNSFAMSNMCKLQINSSQFDVIRMNASLLHLPLIAPGYTVDLALREAYRVLRPNGLLFILVKKGIGLHLIDTGENLGKRVYQLYSHELLNDVLSRNGFTTIEMLDENEQRENCRIDWIAHIAKKI